MLQMASLRWLRRALITVRDVCRYVCFPINFSACRGVYENFSLATAAAPRGKSIGYDHEDLACHFRKEFLAPARHSSDYPVLFHLARLMPESGTILDIGGNIGVHFLRYRPFLKLEKVKWIVCDVPEITKVGRQTCVDEPNIVFVNDLAELGENHPDIFHASSSLQYIACWDLLLKQLIDKGMRPATILIDQVPVYDGRQFVTLQNGGLAFYPHYVFNREQFVGAFTNLGYQLVDTWLVDGQKCLIPFHPDKSVGALSGFCFSDASGLL